MSEFRTFSGKTVDDAMEEACRQLGSPREKLEIEILSGGSSGIFGLVGKKKAQVRARIREEINLLQDLGAKAERTAPARTERAPRPAATQRPAKPAPAPVTAAAEAAPAPVAPVEAAPAPVAPVEAAPVATADQPQAAPEQPAAAEPAATAPARPQGRGSAPVAAPEEPADDASEDVLAGDDEAETDVEAEIEIETETPARSGRRDGRAREERDPDTPPPPLTPELEALVREVMERMLEGILGQLPEFEISGNGERVAVLVRDEDNSGLLIGREGQTLSSIQYLVNRMVIRRHGSPVKVQINTGEYRERQDDNLRKMAIFLADKAKSLGRPQSTKPLSSYHRRVVHLALQEDESISTRSKGDGPLKRVLIVPRSRGESHNGGPRS